MIWHDGERVTTLCGIFLVIVFGALYILSTNTVWNFSTLTTLDGCPLAKDFATFWSASKLALSGKATLVYNINELHDLQYQLLGAHHSSQIGWYYPPSFLLVVLPLGLTNYIFSFIIWITATLALYIVVLYRISHYPILLPLNLCFPGIYLNFMYGQNGYLSGMFLGGGLLLLDRSPLAAGCLFGLLSYKPNLAIMVFVALMFGRYWKALYATIITSLFLLLTSIMIFGYQVWIEYFKIMAIPMKQLEMGIAPWNYHPSFFAATMSATFKVRDAYIVQAVSMLIAVSGVAWVWGNRSSIAIRGAVLVLGTLLFTPYVLIYDLAILALPLCWLWEEGRIKGRLPGELMLLLGGWLMPVFLPSICNKINFLEGKLNIGPIVLLALFLLTLLRQKRFENTTVRHAK